MDKALKKLVIESAQLRQLLSINTKTVVVISLLAVMMAYMQRDTVKPVFLVGWLVMMLMISVIRILVSMYQLKHPVNDYTIVHQRLLMFRVGLIMTSLAWGLDAVLIYERQLNQAHFLLSYILFGISSAAVVSYSIDRVSGLAYIMFSVLPLLISFLFIGGELANTLVIGGIFYVIFITYSVSAINRNMIENILLRYQADQHQEEIKQLAFYDALTNLPNRRMLQDKLKLALDHTKMTNETGALFFIDLDNFKILNDTLGHDMGDQLLIQVAQRLKTCVRETDMVARLGGDEFVIMLQNLSRDYHLAEKTAEYISEKIIETLNAPYQLNDFEYFSTPSVGIAMFGKHGNTHDELLRHADIAMYHAKNSGKNVVRMFDYKMHTFKHQKTNE